MRLNVPSLMFNLGLRDNAANYDDETNERHDAMKVKICQS